MCEQEVLTKGKSYKWNLERNEWELVVEDKAEKQSMKQDSKAERQQNLDYYSRRIGLW